MQARWHYPGSGRFLSIDPLIRAAGVPQSANAYSYTENNPVNGVDPTGTQLLGWQATALGMSGVWPDHLESGYENDKGQRTDKDGNTLTDLVDMAASGVVDAAIVKLHNKIVKKNSDDGGGSEPKGNPKGKSKASQGREGADDTHLQLQLDVGNLEHDLNLKMHELAKNKSDGDAEVLGTMLDGSMNGSNPLETLVEAAAAKWFSGKKSQPLIRDAKVIVQSLTRADTALLSHRKSMNSRYGTSFDTSRPPDRWQQFISRYNEIYGIREQQ